MVEIIYRGTLTKGFVRGIGIVEYGNTYNVDSSFAKRLVSTDAWVYAEKPKKTTKKEIITDYNEVV